MVQDTQDKVVFIRQRMLVPRVDKRVTMVIEDECWNLNWEIEYF
jgi:hypothetical protein